MPERDSPLPRQLSRLIAESVESKEPSPLPGSVPAGAIVPLQGAVPHELRVYFTRRHDKLINHPGEISFPGGRHERGDASLLNTALRELEEEVGVTRDAVCILGRLTGTPTLVSNFTITPFVALLQPDTRMIPREYEVAEIIDVAIRELYSHQITDRGRIYSDRYRLHGITIWGATARILTQLLNAPSPLYFSPAHRPNS